MATPDWLVYIAPIGGMFGTLSTAALALLAFRKGQTVEAKVGSVEQKVTEVHIAVNSRMDRMLELTQSKAEAEGHAALAEAKASAADTLATVRADSAEKVALALQAVPPVPQPEVPVTAPETTTTPSGLGTPIQPPTSLAQAAIEAVAHKLIE